MIPPCRVLRGLTRDVGAPVPPCRVLRGLTRDVGLRSTAAGPCAGGSGSPSLRPRGGPTAPCRLLRGGSPATLTARARPRAPAEGAACCAPTPDRAPRLLA